MEQDWLTSVLKFIRLNLGFVMLTIGFCLVFAWGSYRVTKSYFGTSETPVVQEEISLPPIAQLPEITPVASQVPNTPLIPTPSLVPDPSAVPSLVASPSMAPRATLAPITSVAPIASLPPSPTLAPATPKPSTTPTIVLTPKPTNQPTTPPKPQEMKKPTSAEAYTVKPGDSTSKIAKTLWGNGKLYPEIEKANKLTHNQLLAIGQKLTIPAKPAEKSQGKIASGKSVEVVEGKIIDTTQQTLTPSSHPPKQGHTSKQYEIKVGDSLWKIASEQLGDPYLWTKLYALNKSIIGSNQNLIYPGTTIHLPE